MEYAVQRSYDDNPVTSPSGIPIYTTCRYEKAVTAYACRAGFYNQNGLATWESTSEMSCRDCPIGGTSNMASDEETDCYQPEGTYTGASGTYEITRDEACYYE